MSLWSWCLAWRSRVRWKNCGRFCGLIDTGVRTPRSDSRTVRHLLVFGLHFCEAGRNFDGLCGLRDGVGQDSRQILGSTALASLLPTGSHEVRGPRAQATVRP